MLLVEVISAKDRFLGLDGFVFVAEFDDEELLELLTVIVNAGKSNPFAASSL